MEGMHVEAINIGTSDALGPVGSVRAIVGRGLEGDRYFFPDGAGSGEERSDRGADVPLPWARTIGPIDHPVVTGHDDKTIYVTPIGAQ